MSAPSTPNALNERSWVWHATVASRAAGKVSVLACVETLVAVVIYWWIAIRWDTHWHLLSSVFIAPLLLLRSPESINLGVRWFKKDWLGYTCYKKWPRERRCLLLGGAVFLSCLVTYVLARWLCSLWLVGKHGWALEGWSALIGCLSLVSAVAVANAFFCWNSDQSTDESESLNWSVWVSVFAGAVIGTVVADGIGLAVSAMGIVYYVAFVGAIVGMILGAILGVGAFDCAFHVVSFYCEAVLYGLLGLGGCLRGLFFRMAATLRHLPEGLRRLAENWQENNFWIDSFVPAELMPGIREVEWGLSFDGFVLEMSLEKKLIRRWVSYPLLAAFLFLPAFLYRLNIKATCWFWWPLAYLLKPVPKVDKTSAQKQALCWPWDNPLQMLLILVPGVLVLGLLIVENSDFSLWKEFKNAAAVPIPLKVALSMRWGHIPPWHWALLIVEATGLMMLAIAGNARSHRASKNWDVYAHSGMPRDLWLMDKLMRLRSLAAKAFMVLGLGMCLISFPEWRQRLPGVLLQRLERFYHAEELHERSPASQSLQSGPAEGAQTKAREC